MVAYSTRDLVNDPVAIILFCPKKILSLIPSVLSSFDPMSPINFRPKPSF